MRGAKRPKKVAYALEYVFVPPLDDSACGQLYVWRGLQGLKCGSEAS